MAMTVESLVVEPGTGAAVASLHMTHKVDGDHLEGRLLVMEGVIPPGQLILPHTHSREDECAYVLSGELTYQIGELVRTAPAGTYVVKPRGIPHAFWNATATPATVMEMHVPATMALFYDELAELFASVSPGTPAWQQAFDELSNRYGITQHWERIAAISERHGVGVPRS